LAVVAAADVGRERVVAREDEPHVDSELQHELLKTAALGNL
jgi:hypothetical protein